MRIKLLVDSGIHKAGDVVKLGTQSAMRLIRRGVAIVSKDITNKDTKKK